MKLNHLYKFKIKGWTEKFLSICLLNISFLYIFLPLDIILSLL